MMLQTRREDRGAVVALVALGDQGHPDHLMRSMILQEQPCLLFLMLLLFEASKPMLFVALMQSQQYCFD